VPDAISVNSFVFGLEDFEARGLEADSAAAAFSGAVTTGFSAALAVFFEALFNCMGLFLAHSNNFVDKCLTAAYKLNDFDLGAPEDDSFGPVPFAHDGFVQLNRHAIMRDFQPIEQARNATLRGDFAPLAVYGNLDRICNHFRCCPFVIICISRLVL
jgi:hypothetical protein